MKTFIGIDVSKRSVDVAFSDGARFRVKHFAHNHAQTAEAILAEVPVSDVHIVLEATGNYCYQLATSFHLAGLPVSVVNPLRIKHFGKMRLQRAKTDRYDAKTICQFAQEVPRLPLWQPRPPEQEQLRQVVGAIHDLQVLKTELTNRQEAMAPLPVKSPRCVQVFEHLVAGVETELATLQQELVRLAAAVNQRTFDLLLSIKGIGEITAGAIMGLCGSFEGFETAAQVVAYAGLNPAPYESGTTVRGRGGISKRGHASLRRLLYMGALSAMRYNPACKALYERLLAKGKPKRVARVAVAHKLLRIAFGVVKGGRPFDPNYQPL